jgi:hypothetical protein
MAGGSTWSCDAYSKNGRNTRQAVIVTSRCQPGQMHAAAAAGAVGHGARRALTTHTPVWTGGAGVRDARGTGSRQLLNLDRAGQAKWKYEAISLPRDSCSSSLQASSRCRTVRAARTNRAYMVG